MKKNRCKEKEKRTERRSPVLRQEGQEERSHRNLRPGREREKERERAAKRLTRTKGGKR